MQQCATALRTPAWRPIANANAFPPCCRRLQNTRNTAEVAAACRKLPTRGPCGKTTAQAQAASAAKNRRTALAFLRKLPPGRTALRRLFALLAVTVATALPPLVRRRKARRAELLRHLQSRNARAALAARAARALSSPCVLLSADANKASAFPVLETLAPVPR